MRFNGAVNDLGPDIFSERYRDRGLIALGGMGEVWRVYDEVLQRTVAMKRIRPELCFDEVYRERFREEARATARLEHPGIVPVYDHGELPDGSLFFTMREVRGQTLGSALTAAHGREAGSLTLRELVEVFAQVCRAVAYAHHHGVLHRDLKPDNIMLGPFGEVQVMDWGLVKLLPAPPPTFHSDGTQLGEAVGTPAYMSPEQARGELDAMSPASDVFALGAILYHLLCGRPPLEGTATQPTLIHAYIATAAPALSEVGSEAPWAMPPALVTLCERAMKENPDDRVQSAQELSTEVDDWLRGARRRAEALAHVARARQLEPALHERRQAAQDAQEEAARTLARLPPGSPVAAKEAAWAKEDEAFAAASEADLLELTYVQMLQEALSRDPSLREAHDLLADHYAACLRQADSDRDLRAQLRFRALLARHDQGRHAGLLDGTARVHFRFDQAVQARLGRFVERGRRLVVEELEPLGQVEDVDLRLAPGSYVVGVQHQGRELVVPVAVERGGPPCSPEGEVHLPDLEAGECWVPPGWFVCGGDPEAPDALRRQRRWLDGFVMQRDPVTQGDYLAFLDDLAARGGEGEVRRWLPQGRDGAMFGVVGPDGRFRIDVQDRTLVARSDAPIVLVDHPAARAYAAWRAERDGRPWRLPTSLEWEKAARGVDGRVWPWGNHHEPSWAGTLAAEGVPGLRPVGAFPGDVSPYGVRDLVGGVRDWTDSPFDADGERLEGHAPYVVVRGGAWSSVTPLCRPTGRFGNRPGDRFQSLGFRLVRSV